MTKERMTLQVLSLAGLVACVIPFLPGDAVKIILAAVLSKYLVRASLSL